MSPYRTGEDLEAELVAFLTRFLDSERLSEYQPSKDSPRYW
jgi:hypothetical protein